MVNIYNIALYYYNWTSTNIIDTIDSIITTNRQMVIYKIKSNHKSKVTKRIS